MTLTFVTNYVHHHQLPVADEFYKILDNNYRYIATQELPVWLIKGGYDPSLDRPYIIRSYVSGDAMQKARKLIDESDVVIVGDAPLDWVLERKKQDKVTFHCSERWIKKIDINTFSPITLRQIYKHYYRFRNSRTYMLCASAFAARDVHKYCCFPNRCFKWGYFTSVESFDYEQYHNSKNYDGIIRLMWCARFLDWKHPELPVLLAERLKRLGYHFVIDMFGGGEMFEKTKKMVHEKGLGDCVILKGNLPNALIIEEMRKHEIFLFTSDRYEGWGAVLNEAMSNGCAVVASDKIGSVPFLIDEGKNGFVFKSEDIKSLEKQVLKLLDDSTLRDTMSKAAMKTMQDIWSPQQAASRFITLTDYIIRDNLYNYQVYKGPASWN